ncbi:hypothetical protein RYX36_003634, partial [Vicia faba]
MPEKCSKDQWNEKCSKDQWKCIEDHFEFDYAAGITRVRSTLGERWKSYKYKVRNQYFYPNKSKEEILSNPPSSIDPIEWTSFVHHYCDPKIKEKILENLSEDKERTVTVDISSKINVYCDDSIEKICGVEHSGRVRDLGLG